MGGFKVAILSLTAMVSVGIAQDPFFSKQDAVGYIVIDKDGTVEKYVVLESSEGVKLVKTDVEPEEILKQGGKKK